MNNTKSVQARALSQGYRIDAHNHVLVGLQCLAEWIHKKHKIIVNPEFSPFGGYIYRVTQKGEERVFKSKKYSDYNECFTEGLEYALDLIEARQHAQSKIPNHGVEEL